MPEFCAELTKAAHPADRAGFRAYKLVRQQTFHLKGVGTTHDYDSSFEQGDPTLWNHFMNELSF